jgi:hypothetical protein
MSMRNDPPVSERSESNVPDTIDALIDHAARRLVAGEPSSSLRRGVRDRIGTRRPVWGLAPAWGVAAAAAIAAVFVGRTFVGAPDIRTTNPPATVSPVIDVALHAPQPTPIQPVPSTSRQFARRPAAEVTAPPPAEEESLIPPITIAPLAPAQIAVDVSSGVMPIDIAPLQIEPLLGQ